MKIGLKVLCVLLLSRPIWADPLDRARRARTDELPALCLAQSRLATGLEARSLEIWALDHCFETERAWKQLDALSRTDRSHESKSGQAAFLLLRADMQRGAERPDLAERDYLAVIELEPNSAAAERARFGLALLGGTDQKWLDQSQSQLAHHPELPPQLLEEQQWCKGRVCQQNGQWEQAWNALALARRLAAQRHALALQGCIELNLARVEGELNLDSLARQVEAQRHFHEGGDSFGELLALRAQSDNWKNQFATTPTVPRQLLQRLRAVRPPAVGRAWLQVAIAGAQSHTESRAFAERELERQANQGGPIARAQACRYRAYLAVLDSNFDQARLWTDRALHSLGKLRVRSENPLYGHLSQLDLRSELAEYQQVSGHPTEALANFRDALDVLDREGGKLPTQLFYDYIYLQLAADDPRVEQSWSLCQRLVARSRNPQEQANIYDVLLYAVSGNSDSVEGPGLFQSYHLPEGSLAQRFLVHDLAEPALAAFHRARQGSGRKTKWLISEGLCNHLLGRFSEAISAYQLAFEAALAGDQRNYLFITAQDLARELEQQGRFDEARDCLLRALPKATPPWGPQRIQMMLADWYRIHGQPAEAIRVADQFLSEKTGIQYIETSDVLSIKAAALDALHRRDEAIALLRQDCAELRKIKDNYGLSSHLSQLARLELAAGHSDLALACWREALACPSTNPHLSRLARLTMEPMRVLRSSEPGQAAAMGEALLTRIVDSQTMLYRPPVAGSAAERPLRQLLELTVACLVADHQNARASHWLEAYRAWQSRPEVPGLEVVEQKRQTLRLLSLNDKSMPQRLEAREDLLATLNRLRRDNPELESLLPAASPELAQLQEHLPSDSLVLQYYPGEEDLFILAQRSTGLKVYQVPVPRALLRKTIQAWRKALTDPQTAPPEALRKQLYAWLLQPVQGLSEAKRVLALPTDALWYLPLDSLESVGEREWCQLTPPDLAMLELAPARTPGQPLVLGPSADADLPGASEEARELARMLPQCRLLEGKGATRAALRQLSPTASILHFCTHGLVESGDLNDSFLKLGDGPLTLQDVYGLRLPKGALVVLSACSTGLGEQTPGRAVTSLASAFRAAGASSVVSTLWPVEDQPTRKLMLAFYGGLEHGLGRAAALEQAKLQLSRQPGYAHPFYWAGFTLSGDPR